MCIYIYIHTYIYNIIAIYNPDPCLCMYAEVCARLVDPDPSVRRRQQNTLEGTLSAAPVASQSLKLIVGKSPALVDRPVNPAPLIFVGIVIVDYCIL